MKLKNVRSDGVGGRVEDDDHDQGDHGDADQQPLAGAGVRHLASSTRTSRHSGMRGVARGRPVLPSAAGLVGCGWAGAHAGTPSRWVSAVSCRKRSSRPAPSAGRSSSRVIPRPRRHLADLARLDVAAQPGPRGSCGSRPPGGRRPAPRAGQPGRRRRGAGAAPAWCPARRPCPSDQDQVVGDLLDLVQQVGGEQHGAAVARRTPAAGRASSGCRPGRGRWPARRGSGCGGCRAARWRCRVAGACRGSSSEPALGLHRGQRHQLEHLVDTRIRQSHGSAPMVRTSRPVRPSCWAEASSRTPTSRPGFGMSLYRARRS